MKAITERQAVLFDLDGTLTDPAEGITRSVQEALRQIEESNYRKDLEKEGFRQIDAYGICFWKKEAMVQRLP